MKVFVFMNHRIRRRNTKGPVIRVQNSDSTNYREGNIVVINGPSIVRFDHRGLPFAPEHHVTAWIEADDKDVAVR